MAIIYNIGDLKIEVKRDLYPVLPAEGECGHGSLVFDERGEIVTCDLCGKQVSAWWAFMYLTRRYQDLVDRQRERERQVREQEARVLTHKAAIAVEDAWRKKKMVPTCPHCWKPILPQNGFGSKGSKSREHYAHELKPLEFRMAPEVFKGRRTPESA